MGYIMDYIKNDVIEEKRLINSMIKDNVPMSRIKEVTERSKREIEAIWHNGEDSENLITDFMKD